MADYLTKKTTIKAVGVQAEKSQTVEYTIYFIFGVIVTLLLFRLGFKLTGANPVSGFVSFIYAVTGLFIMPFVGIFHQATSTGVEVTAVLEPATLVGIIVYIILAWGIVQLVEILSGRLQ